MRTVLCFSLLLMCCTAVHGFADLMTHFQYKDSNHRVESLGSIAINTIGQLEEMVAALERQAKGDWRKWKKKCH